jgi:hypothetical protein
MSNYPNASGKQSKSGAWISMSSNEYANMPQEKTMSKVSNAPEDLVQPYEGDPAASMRQERRDEAQFRKASRGGERKV